MYDKKPFLYDLRMKMFGQKYTKKEEFILTLYIGIVLCGIGPLANILQTYKLLDVNANNELTSFNQGLLFILYLAIYMVSVSPIVYYTTKAIVELLIWLFHKLTFNRFKRARF
jgi:hypothetical protein